MAGGTATVADGVRCDMLVLLVQRHEPPRPGRLQGPSGPLQKGLEIEKTSSFDQEEESEAYDDGPVAVQARECRCWVHVRGVGGRDEEAEWW
jgi:hypothetical protein